MRTAQCHAPVFIGNHSPLDTSQHEPEAKYLTALRVLRISNELVRKQLVITQNIEQLVLIESQHEARALMRQRPRPMNVKQCLALQASKRGAGDRFTWGMGDSINSSYVAPWQGLPRMKTQVEDSITFEENMYRRLQRERGEIDDELQGLVARRRVCQQALHAHDLAAKALKIELQRAEHARDELQNAIDADTVEEGRLEGLKARLAEAEEEKTHNEALYGDAVRNRDAQRARQSEVDAEVREVEARQRAADQRVRVAAEAVRAAAEERQARLLAKNTAIDQQRGAEDAREAKQRLSAEQTELVAEFHAKAGAIGARVAVGAGETFESIEKKLLKLEADIRNHEAR